MNRRRFLQVAASLPLASSAASGPFPARAEAAAFDRSIVRQIARDAASKPFKAPDSKLPDNLKNLDYDRYRAIRFLPEQALWRGDKLPFEVQFFHRGFFYAPRVDIYEVANGQATRIAYRPDAFSFGGTPPPSPGADLGFAGFRLVNLEKGFGEVAAFAGASYFRMIGRGQKYGTSARGLALNTTSAEGEEFPVFRQFWIQRPDSRAQDVSMFALLDRLSSSGPIRQNASCRSTEVCNR